MTLQIGLIGCGGISHAHRHAMKDQSEARFVAFCDTDEPKAHEAANAEGGKAFVDVERMLDDQRLNGIVICTPPTVRAQPMEAAARRGLPVLCEKPPAMTLDVARQSEQIIARYNAIVSVAFLFRYFPVVDRLRELIDNRPVAYAHSRYLGNVANNTEFQQSKPWFLLKEQSGGPILDQAIHLLDLVRFLFGDVDEVFAQGGFRTRARDESNTAEDTVTLQFVTHSGVLASHSHCWGHDRWLDELEITGADFRLLIDLNTQRLTGINRGENVDCQLAVNGYQREQRVWLDVIRTGDRSLIRSPHADAARSLALCLAVNRSVDSGHPEKVEPL
jgi:predicted dehydrogenase